MTARAAIVAVAREVCSTLRCNAMILYQLLHKPVCCRTCCMCMVIYYCSFRCMGTLWNRAMCSTMEQKYCHATLTNKCAMQSAERLDVASKAIVRRTLLTGSAYRSKQLRTKQAWTYLALATWLHWMTLADVAACAHQQMLTNWWCNHAYMGEMLRRVCAWKGLSNVQVVLSSQVGLQEVCIWLKGTPVLKRAQLLGRWPVPWAWHRGTCDQSLLDRAPLAACTDCGCGLWR